MDDLTSEFLEETNESLDALDLDIVALEQNPNDLEIIRNIFRVMHTIKGTCGFLGLTRLEGIAHVAENIMDKLRDEVFKVTPEITSLVLEAIDSIKSIIEHLEEHGEEPEGDDSDLLNRMNQCAETGQVGGAPASSSSEDAGAAEQSPPEEAAPAAESSPEPAADEGPKTPDLDEEIDFEPVQAEYVEVPTSKPAADAGPKTPDLDEEVDFEPVQAEYVEVPASNPPQEAAKAEKPQEEEKPPAVSDAAKKDAVNEGLKVAAEESPKKKTTAGQSIRVGLDVLENLIQMVGELVLTRNQLLQMTRRQSGADGEYSGPLQRLNLITTELQEGIMKTRMQPIGNAWAKFPRLVRDLAVELDKRIELKMIGAETDLDRQMLEAIKDPLTHMVRNSADHGIETPEERVAAGKPEAGTVVLSAYHEGGHIVIKISDDGKGIDVERIKAKAIENQLASPAELENLSEKQILRFIFKAGFSTAEQVTAVSGRGVGMDVVVSNIEKIGGTVELDSTLGKGSEFLIKLPLTLAIMPVLIVETVGELFAIPQIRVSEIVRAETDPGKEVKDDSVDYVIETINDSPVLRLRGRLLPLISLSKVLNLERQDPANDNEGLSLDEAVEPFVVVCEVGSQFIGLMVDKVFHTEEIVVKPVAPILKNLEVYSGSTILGDGSVILIVDPNGIMKVSGIGEIGEAKKEESEEGQLSPDERVVSFLVFKSWANAPMAVPLELVSRLEEIDVKDMEWSGDYRVVQYRGGLMRLMMTHPSAELPEEGLHDVIVFVDGDRTMGLVVEEILDIVRQKMDVKSLVGSNGLLGSMVINGQTTDLIDVSHYFSQAYSDWLSESDADVAIAGVEQQKHVLLVDDSPFFRKFMEPVLSMAGYVVTTAENAMDGLAILDDRYESFDIIVSDIDMPEMSGVEFIKKCRADDRFAPKSFIALTSHNEADLGDSLALFDAFVSKSDRDKLVAVIGSLLNKVDEEAAA